MAGFRASDLELTSPAAPGSRHALRFGQPSD